MIYVALLFASLGLALLTAPRDELVTEVTLDADPSRVWQVLTDGASFAAWNPFITSMTGELVEGGRITNVMRPSGGSPMTFSPTVLTVRPAKELRWLGRLPVPRIFDGEHYFLLEAREDGRTRLVHGERFRGVLFWFLRAERFRGDFEAMNAALARRVGDSAR